MRSYHEHLKSITSPAKKPAFRSSAIFPALHSEAFTTRILFMGYWVLKRQIDRLGWVTTLRSQNGHVLFRETTEVTEAKAYRIEISELLKKAGMEDVEEFVGTIECEFFSSTPLVFPYPALVINFYSSTFSSVVHTAQRVYNDAEDKEINTASSVPEGGFTIYSDKEREPFLTVINGPKLEKHAELTLHIVNHQGDEISHTYTFDQLSPYQIEILKPAEQIDLEAFLNHQPGTVKVLHHLEWIYPRLVVGNLSKEPVAAAITHSYYDCSKAKDPSDYWRKPEDLWNSASLMVPFVADSKRTTFVTFYPLYSPAAFSVSVEFYNSVGELVSTVENVLSFDTPLDGFKKLELKQLVDNQKIKQAQTARILANPTKGAIPSRIKVGLDIGKEGSLPCNICTNLVPFLPEMENKPFTFKWCPVIGKVWVVNSSPAKNYQRPAEVALTFYREEDSHTASHTVTLPPHGSYVFSTEDYADFFQGKPGWVTAVSTNPHILTYYFTEGLSGITGGDHGF